MQEKLYSTNKGDIHYWAKLSLPDAPTLVFLPGLTADHRLFDHQIEAFTGKYNLLVWDAPGHNASRPFQLDFSLSDKAVWLHELLRAEGIARPVLIGQSMGGYVSQMYMELFPDDVLGFISIDSAPLQRAYMSALEIYLLKHTRFLYSFFSWNALKKAGPNGCAVTPYGRELMRTMMECYEEDAYRDLITHGYQILAEAVEQDLPYRISCPAVLICGKKDQAGSAKHYNKMWARKTQLPFHLIDHAGHNANTDAPEAVNQVISEFVESITSK